MGRGRGNQSRAARLKARQAARVGTSTTSAPAAPLEPAFVPDLPELDDITGRWTRHIQDAKSKAAREHAMERMEGELSLAAAPGVLSAVRGERWDEVRGWLADHHRRMGNEAQVQAVLGAADDAFAPLASIARMTPHWDDLDTEGLAGVIAPVFRVEAAADNRERDLVCSGHDLARPLARIRQMALRGENKELLYRHDGSTAVGSGGTHHTMARAQRAARIALEGQAKMLPDHVPVMEVVVRVGNEVLHDILAAHKDHEAFAGVVAHLADPISEIREYGVSARAVFLATIDGRPARIEYSTALGRTRSKDPGAAGERVLLMLASHGHEGLFVEPELLPEDAEAPSVDPASLLGPERCRHAAARWTTTTTTEARLRCDDCFEAAVLRIPAHRVPRSHPAYRELDESRYVNEVAFWNEVHGRDPDPAGTLAAMRARDGYDSMRVSDHFTELARPTARPISVAAAMNRR